MKKVHLSLVLDSNQYHVGHSEICRHFVGKTSDEYLNGLVASLAQANNAIFDVMQIEKVRITIKQENRQLMDRLMATAGYLDSCKYVDDAAMQASALVLKQLFDSCGKPFARMKASERVGAVKTLLSKLSSPSMKEHVDRLPEMESRIKGVRDASETLDEALYQADKAKGTAPKGQSLMPLKREAAVRLETLVDYLEAMAKKAPADYAEHYAVVMQIITRLNATRRRSDYLHIEVELEDDKADDKVEESPVSIGA